MSVRWSVIKYVPDVFRFEPANVGVVVFAEGRTALRFMGESRIEGRADGRRARGMKIDPDEYSRWIRYFRRKAAEDAWDDVLAAMRARPDLPFYVDGGGTFPEAPASALQECLEVIYEDLVEGDTAEKVGLPDQLSFAGRVARVIELISVPLVRDVAVPGVFYSTTRSRPRSRVERTVKFSYGYSNGHLHLMEPVSLPSHALNFFARAEAVSRVDPGLRFLAFYRGDTFAGYEEDLEVIESYAEAVDVDEPQLELVAEHVQEFLELGEPELERE